MRKADAFDQGLQTGPKTAVSGANKTPACHCEQPAGPTSQGEPAPFKGVRRSADGGAGVPWVGAHDHLNLPIKGIRLSMPEGGADDANLEMPLRIGDDLAIGGMISGLNGNNSAADVRVLFVNVFGELGFCAGWSKDQYFASIADGIQNLV
jgi:hypothetical protein